MKNTICLNMIVKNESHVIKRCLGSVKNLIDYWVIVDTGSSDGTQEIIRDFLQDIPGELYEQPWVNFGHNRQEALEFAKDKSDYILFIDADDRLVFSEPFSTPTLEADAYVVVQKDSSKPMSRENKIFLLIKNGLDFKWDGVIHEFLKCESKKQIEIFPNAYIECLNDGHRSQDVGKVFKDIEVLKQAVKTYPANSRYVLYLANSYWFVEEAALALIYFEKRAGMGGDPIEVYHSLLFGALAHQKLGCSPEAFIHYLSKAYLYRPSRAESLYEIARHYAVTENFFLGYIVSKIAVSIPKTSDNLFVESWVYDWGVSLYLFICASGIGKYEEAYLIVQQLLKNPLLPGAISTHFKLNECSQLLKDSLLKGSQAC